MPTVLDYLQNCKTSGKAAVVEIKSALTEEQTEKLIHEIASGDYLPKTIFISFNVQALKYIRAMLPDQSIQLLSIRYKK